MQRLVEVSRKVAVGAYDRHAGCEYDIVALVAMRTDSVHVSKEVIGVPSNPKHGSVNLIKRK